MTGVVRAVPVLDELVREEGSVVLLAASGGHRVVRLSPLGQAVRELTPHGLPLEALTSALTSIFGVPDSDPSTTVRAVVDALALEGVVVLEG